MQRTETTEPALLRRAIKIERYAEVLAHVLHFGTERIEEVVRRFGLSVEGWRAIDAAWTEDLAESIRRNQQDLALRFTATLAKRRRRLSQEHPALDAVGDGGVSAAETSPAARASSASGAARAVAVPSFMTAPAATSSPVPPARAEMVAAPAVRPAEAGDAPAEKPITQAMPAMGAAGEPLPFAAGAAPEAALRSALDHAALAQGPRLARGPALGVTAPTEGERLAAIARRILPFQPTPGSSGARESEPAPPPDGPSPAAEVVGGLPLERHASLHVELGLHPEQGAQTLRRYGLSAEQHARLDEMWQARIAQDPGVRAAWEDACARYRAWLLRNRP